MGKGRKSDRIKIRKVARQEGHHGVVLYLPHFLVLGTYLLLGARLFALISQYAVNILYWDQWDFDEATLFQHHSLWEMFAWQHGPHRQGLGALLQKLIEPWFHWNGRSEAFGIGAIIFSAAVLALLLKIRLYGKIAHSDVIIPLLFLTPLQYETLVLIPNPAHGPLPLFMIVLYCLCWLIRPFHWRYICVLLANFLSIYTGFGIFIGVVTPALLAIDYYANARHMASKYRWGIAVALTISIASLVSFFVHYRFDPAVDCFSPVPENPVMYPWFAAIMFASVAGLKISLLGLTFVTLIGLIALLSLVVALLITSKRLLAREADTWPRDAAIGALLAYCAIFCLNTAYGRLCLGLPAASNSRYTPYVVLGLFGLYLYALSNQGRNLRVFLVLSLLVYAMLGARPLNSFDARIIEYKNSHKKIWRACYLARHNIYACNALTHYPIYPLSKATHLQEKLDFLEGNHLNLYDNSQ